MPKFRVELTAWVEATYATEIEAPDDIVARELAIKAGLALCETRHWTVLPSGSVINLEIFDCEER